MTQGHITLTLKWNYTQRTWDLSTFDKEAPYKTHLRTNYFQALTNKLQAVDKGRFQKRFSGFWPLRGGGYPPLSVKLFWSQWLSVKGRLFGEMKKKTCWHIFPHLPVHIFTFLILVLENDKLSVWQLTTPISFSTHRWDFKGKNTFSPFSCPISPLFHYSVTLWKVMELLLLNKSCSYWRLSRGLHR